MSSLDEWAEDFAKAVEDYRRSATSRYISMDAGRIFNFILRHPSDFPAVIQFIQSEWGTLRMKDMIGKYLRAAGELHRIYKVDPSQSAMGGGVMYVYNKQARISEMKER